MLLQELFKGLDLVLDTLPSPVVRTLQATIVAICAPEPRRACRARRSSSCQHNAASEAEPITERQVHVCFIVSKKGSGRRNPNLLLLPQRIDVDSHGKNPDVDEPALVGGGSAPERTVDLDALGKCLQR
jgi:hypothetical protein